jgi:hypothetical protein
MLKTKWSNTAPLLVFGLIVLAVFLVLSVVGYTASLDILLSILTPLVAIFLGGLGLRIYNKEPEMKQDHFHALYLWISIGLFVLALSEVAIALLDFSSISLEIKMTVSLIQIPGLLLWGFGVMQYLKSVNLALEIIDSTILWMSLLIITSLATLTLVVCATLFLPWISIVDTLIISPMVIGQCLFATILLVLVWSFRDGVVAKPLLLMLVGLLLYLVRTVYWAFSTSVIGTPLNSIFALEAYVFLGLALFFIQDIGSKTDKGGV